MSRFFRNTAVADFTHKIPFLLGKNTRRLPFLYLLFLLSSGIEFLGIGLIGPFIAMIMYPEKIVARYPWIEGLFGGIGTDTIILILGALLVGAFALKGVAYYVVQRNMIRFSYRCRTDLVSRLLSNYQHMPYHMLMQRNSSTFIVNLSTHANLFSDAVLIQIMRGSVELFVLIGLFGLLAYINFWAVIIPGIYFSIVLAGWDRILKRRFIRYGRILSQAEAGVISTVNHAVGALKEIRLLGSERFFHRAVIRHAEAIAHAGTHSRVLQGLQRYIFETSLVLLVVLAIYVIMQSGREPASAFAMLGVFGVAAIRLLPSISQIGFSFSTVRSHLYAVESLYNDLQILSQKIPVIAQDGASIDQGRQGAVKDFNILACRNVDYAYPGNDQAVLRQINLTIRRGESIGIIGKSGSGKTTLADILLGLLTPVKGGVYLGEQEINPPSEKGWLQAWQANVLYIPQDMFLIDDTIRHNIALGVDDGDIDEKLLRHAVRQAELQPVVDGLSEGLDTPIGERGVRLSGGQRQRIGIARAFYFGREVVVMDEATSALDNETEAEILKFVSTFREKRTIIIIAHRLTTIRNCDRIFRLEDGCITAQGSYEEVVAKHDRNEGKSTVDTGEAAG